MELYIVVSSIVLLATFVLSLAAVILIVRSERKRKLVSDVALTYMSKMTEDGLIKQVEKKSKDPKAIDVPEVVDYFEIHKHPQFKAGGVGWIKIDQFSLDLYPTNYVVNYQNFLKDSAYDFGLVLEIRDNTYDQYTQLRWRPHPNYILTR